ncbi:hypothetical protein ASD24_25825 [Paenibacillus sp. Root52]|uniref:Uncharacterized membrane protein YkvA (DUF1232 family) n=1 Tax=Paenibacillus amylolyticus TaxID=1451 RepID=A0AAP5GYA5_PAEAM|nr:MULTISPECIES: hypothetical protein [Paenibacillus]KQY88143.1 hypothetical protein ASD24_25825 [Paenibacillus sp. Root52]MCG7377150.1 hypothetical protein [Paenibacillus sp. ACRSA]MDR6722547.1 uncharacterized membrane protein YkvA (DUF1232 family) [Paenibacillus amylolyticus]
MKWRRLLSFKRWSEVFRRLPRLLRATEIPLREKLLFIIPALLYWVLPDVMPFMPIDDIGVTLILMNWFVSRAERKYPVLPSGTAS